MASCAIEGGGGGGGVWESGDHFDLVIVCGRASAPVEVSTAPGGVLQAAEYTWIEWLKYEWPFCGNANKWTLILRASWGPCP